MQQNLLEDILIKQYLLFNPDASTNDILARVIIENSIIVYCKIDSDTTNIDHLLDKNYPRPSGKWRYNFCGSGGATMNIRVPTEPYIPFYKLNTATDNIYDFISSVLCVIHPLEFISGERIQSLADVVVGDKTELYHNNPYNANFSRETLDIDDPDIETKIQRHERIFVFTHLLSKLYGCSAGEQMEGRVLISHNSDDAPPAAAPIALRQQFSQNLPVAASGAAATAIGIPIGIENNRWFNYADLDTLVWCDATNPRSPIVKTKDVYFYFSLETHPSRAEAYTILSKKPGLEWNIRRPKREYFEELAHHRYAICPRGHGIDTHRVWECLYLNVIPIVVSADYIDAFVGLPIVVLEDWSQFDISALPKEPTFEGQNLAKITMNYWRARIQSS